MARPGAALLSVFGLLAVLSLACAPAHTERAARVEAKVDAANGKLDQLLAAQALSQAALDELLALARQQGTGEITLFFPPASSTLLPDERDRLVAFLDRLVFEAHGRPLLFVSLGAATEWRKPAHTQRLSQARAEAPRALVAQHLVNTPHRWLRREGLGDAIAPTGAGGRAWHHVRLIAVYDEGALPPLPAKGGVQ